MKSNSVKITGLILMLLLFAVACSGQEEPTATPQPAETTQEEAPTEQPPTAVPPTAEPALETAPTVIPPRDDQTSEAGPEELQSPLEEMEHNPDDRLIDITWEWVSRDPNGNDIPPINVSDPERYTIIFNEDGTFNATLDCNNASGQYATPEPGQIFMELGPTTLAACPEDSLDTEMSNMFGPVQSYRISENSNNLTLIWAAGGPIDVFRNAAVEIPGEEEVRAIPADAIELNTGSLASSYQWEVRPGNPIPPGPGGQGFPPHIVMTFDGSSAEDALINGGAIAYLFPTAAYVALYDAAGNSIVSDQVARLQELIDSAAERAEIPESPMPLLPPPSSFMGRWAQFADLDFAAGSGIRYVSEAPNRQDIGPWTNFGTAFYYQGLTADNQFYVSLRWPVSTEALPNTPDDVPEDIITVSTDPDTYPTYLQETKDSLNALTPSDWIPNLSEIDAMVSSLNFPTTGGEEGGEAEEGEGESTGDPDEEVDLPEPEDGVPTGTVTAPDGVFIRTGPGTDYPSVGAIAFEESGEIVGVSEDGGWWVFDVPESLNAPNNQGWVSADFIDAQNASNVPVVEAPDLEPAITGTTWGWVSITSPAGVTAVDDPSLYTILFNEDGSAAIKADCNNVIASYTTDGGSISITPGPSTLVACPEGSLDTQFLDNLSNAAVYFFQDGDLYMDLFADAGTMRFSPQSGTTEPTPPADENDPATATGTVLRVASFGPEGAQQPPLEGTTLTALFSDTQVSGSAGCNDYTGGLVPVDDHFTIGPLATTQKLCNEPEGIMEQEQAYLSALQAVNGFQWETEQVNNAEIITAGQLFYSTAEGLPGVINLISQS